MKIAQMVRWFAGACVLALAFAVWIQPIEGQVQPTATRYGIPSLTEPDQGFVIDSIAPETGFVTFATSPREGLLLPGDPGDPAEARALRFVELYGAPFGLTATSQVQLISASPVDALGVEHVKFQQVHNGVPVRAAEFIVHLRGARAMAANGRTLKDLPANVIPEIAGNIAQAAAVALIAKHNPDQAADAAYSEPRLEILNRALLSSPSGFGSRLAWFVEATGPALRQFIWVDAQSGVVLLDFSQLTEAKNRRVHNANNTNTLPGTLVRSEGGPATGDADADKAYDYAGLTYDYFFTNHGRDSYDGAGAMLISTVHYCEPGSCPNYGNAFWNGTQMVYGNGYASADDVVGHELAHAVTERTAGLLYYTQSGALNESFSDIFGETLDQTDGVGTDTPAVKWKLGEDLAIGAIRDMLNPNLFGDPARMGDPNFFCTDSPWTDPQGDRGGVHINSGVPNKAFALMADGGTFNGKTVTAIGLTKAAKIQYRALSTYLTSGSTFLDNYNALNRSCTDLIGTVGITAADCTQVINALQAVEMNSTWGCTGATLPPPMCPTGVPTTIFSDTFEPGLANWTPASTTTNQWVLDNGYAKGGQQMAYGIDPDAASDHNLAMTSGVTIPPAGRLYFDHAFEFENDFFELYDGGVLEYSAGGGAWTDAGGLIDAGQPYVGQISGGNAALGGRQGFAKLSYGYTATRLNLASLAGQNVKFRFRIGSDPAVASLGWVIDNVSIYSCTAATVPGAPTGVSGVRGNGQVTVSFTPPANNGGSAITSYTATASPGGATASGAGSPLTVTGLTNGTAYAFTVTATNASGTSVPSAPSAAVTPATTPGAPTGVSATADNAQATVSFTPPASNGGLAITSYTVTSSPGGVTASGSASPITVTGLTNGTAYTFTVTATNGVGSGAASAPSAAVTPSGNPGPPTGVSGVRGNGLVTVSFTAPANTGGSAITSYTATASPGGATASGAGSPLTVTGLPNGTAYTFTVTATNASGTGAASAPSAAVTPATTPGAPTNVSGTRGNLQIAVFFSPASSGGDPITSYTVTASPGGATASGSSSPITVSGLTNGTAYTVTVTATNSVGTGPASAASPPVTPATVPGAPTSVSAIGGNAQASVSFTAPTSNGGDPITSYTVTASPGGATATGGASPITVPGLTNGTSYTFTVRATNGVGAGAPSTASNAVTPTAVPGTPLNFAVTASGLSILGTWTSTGGAPTAHALQVATSAAFTSIVFSMPLGAASSFSLDAPPGTVGTFFFRVIATNSFGSSAPTAAVGVAVPGPITPPGPPVLQNAVVAGNTVSLNWTPGPGGAPSSYLLLVGSSPGSSNVGAFPMGTFTTISSSAPNGTYFARVQASNAGGSAFSNEISFVVGTPCVAPGPPTSPSVTRSGNSITVSWGTPATGSGPFSYTIVAGTSAGASNLGLFPVGNVTTISSGVPSGSYFLRVLASNACGVSGNSAEVSVIVP